MPRTDVLVIGSGVAGLSSALYIARSGLRVTVLERATLASGSTSRASGLFGQMRGSVAATRLLMESREIMLALQTDYKRQLYQETGSVRVAQTSARAAELEKDVATARAAGLDVQIAGAAELQARMPYLRANDILAGSFAPTDGYLEPPELAKAYIALGRKAGVEYLERRPVERVEIKNGHTVGVEAAGKRFEAPVVINAAGPWSFLVADTANQPLPTAGVAHYYFTTRTGTPAGVCDRSPTLRDRENRIYSRPCGGGLRVGMYEALPETVDVASLPENFAMATMTAGRAHPLIRQLLQAAQQRFDGIGDTTPIEVRGGIMSFTPDGGALLGEMPDIKGFYHCAGFCGHGVTQSPIIGKLMAALIVHGQRNEDLAQLAADRFWDVAALRERQEVSRQCLAAYGNYYGLAAEALQQSP